MDNNIKIFDLENEENLMLIDLNDLIDIKYENTYILRFEEGSGKRSRTSSDNMINPDLIQPNSKINFKDY